MYRRVFQPLKQLSRASSTVRASVARTHTPRRWKSTSSSSNAHQAKPEGKRPPPLAWLAVASIVFGGYYTLIRNAPKPAEKTKATPKPDAEPETTTPAFNKDEVTVVFVLGGPGSGKGTNCARLVKDFGFVHLSAGDLLREEQERPGSEYGDLIRHHIKEGLIVPKEVTIALLRNAMKASGKTRFLIDGFPRAMDQALKFEEIVVEGKAVLYFECPEEVMLERLLNRGKTSGRADDNIESIRKRFKTFRDTSYPVIEYYEKQNKVFKVSCNKSPDEVYADTKAIFTNMLEAPEVAVASTS